MDCILGVGGKDDEAITKVFQLTEEQRENLKNWGAELKIRNELLEDRAKYLMKKHEESSPEILVTVSKEYKQLVDSMKQNVRMMDKRLLTTFSDQQYDRYTKLCNQMALRPIYINRSVDENWAFCNELEEEFLFLSKIFLHVQNPYSPLSFFIRSRNSTPFFILGDQDVIKFRYKSLV